MQSTASAQAAEMQVGRGPCAPSLLPYSMQGLPCGFKACPAEEGLVPSESSAVGPCTKPTLLPCDPTDGCDGAIKEGIGDTWSILGMCRCLIKHQEAPELLAVAVLAGLKGRFPGWAMCSSWLPFFCSL